MTDYFSVQVFSRVCLSEFFFKSVAPSGRKREKKRGRGGFAERQIVYAPFVILLLASASISSAPGTNGF